MKGTDVNVSSRTSYRRNIFQAAVWKLTVPLNELHSTEPPSTSDLLTLSFSFHGVS